MSLFSHSALGIHERGEHHTRDDRKKTTKCRCIQKCVTNVCKGVLQTELSLDFLDVKFGHLSSFTFELRLLTTPRWANELGNRNPDWYREEMQSAQRKAAAEQQV